MTNKEGGEVFEGVDRGGHSEWRGGDGCAGTGRKASDTPRVAILETIITTNNR